MASSSSSSPFAGFRFSPNDKELVSYYLKRISRGKSLPDVPIHHVNIYESNPQRLSEEYKKGNDKEWFFITERTTTVMKGGKRQKRIDNGGYWQATVGAKKIKAGHGMVGYKTTLVYYVGKPLKGVKTDWLMKEYWLDSSDDDNKMVDYAICKIYQSQTARKKKKEEGSQELEVKSENPHYSVQPFQPQFWSATMDAIQPWSLEHFDNLHI